MTQALQTVFINEAQAMAAIRGQIAPFCRQQWAGGPVRLAVTIEPEADQRTLKQNAFLWGFVYRHISEQAQLEGIGATADGWHLYYKRMHLGYRFKKIVLPGKKRPSVIKELRSTTGLKVGPMSKYMDKTMAHAATVFGVCFPADITWENYRP